MSYPRSKALVIWIVLVSGSYLVASCGDDGEKAGPVAKLPAKAPQPQQPIVMEWYPRPKYPPPPTAYSPSSGPPLTGTEQAQSGYPYSYPQPREEDQPPPGSSTWHQGWQSPDRSRQYPIEPQYPSQRRPWGEFPPLEKKKKKTSTLPEQRPDTMPYGGWPGYGYYGYGYGSTDPLMGAPGWGGGLYGIYPQMGPPLYAW